MNLENYIIKNYPTLGMKKCMEDTQATRGVIQSIVNKHKLKVDKKSLSKIISNGKIKKQEEYNINIETFTKNLDENSSYILGLLWADGYISKNNPTIKKRNIITLECLYEDMKNFAPIFEKTGVWLYYNRQRENKKMVTTAYTSNPLFHKFLTDYDYNLKSIVSPNKIISTISTNFISYFLLGVIDGDGCFYFNKKNGLRQFTLTGSFNQDWLAFEKIFYKLNINYKIIRKKNKKSGYSQLRITNRDNISKLGEYVYSNFKTDKIGLLRKYRKYLEIIS